ncbi:MAG: GTP-binding protein EngA, partial [uncultured Gemmatimonadaceae bacterium]
EQQQHQPSRRRPRRPPQRGQVGALQPHRRPEHGDRERRGGHHARPPLRARRVEQEDVLARGHRRPHRRPQRADGRRDPPAGAAGDRRGRPHDARRGRQERAPPERPPRARPPARRAQAVGGGGQQGRRPAVHRLLRVLRARGGRPDPGVGHQRQGLGRPARRAGREDPRRERGRDRGAARGGDRPPQRGEVVDREPPPRRGPARGVRSRRHHARLDRHALPLPRARARVRRHRRAPAPVQDRRRHRVLLLAPLAPRDRPRRHLRPRPRRHPGAREPGPQDRGAGVGGGARARGGREQVGPQGEGPEHGGQVPDRGRREGPLPQVRPLHLHLRHHRAAHHQAARRAARGRRGAPQAHPHLADQRGAAEHGRAAAAAAGGGARDQAELRHPGRDGAAHDRGVRQQPGRAAGALRALHAQPVSRGVRLHGEPAAHRAPAQVHPRRV